MRPARRLPVLFLVEDQLRDLGPGESRRRRRHRGWSDRSGLHGAVDGTDFLASLETMRDAVSYVKPAKAPRSFMRTSCGARTRIQMTSACTSRKRAQAEAKQDPSSFSRNS